MKHKTALSAIKDWLSPLYPQTRCPVCYFLVFVENDGRMESHGSGAAPCLGSGRNDEELADELDRASCQTTRNVVTSDQATETTGEHS